MVSAGYITDDQLKEALGIQKQSEGKRIGQVLIEMGYVTEEQMLSALANRLDMQLIDLNSYTIDPEVVKLVPKQMAEQYVMLPIGQENGEVILAVNDPLNLYAIEDIRQTVGMPVRTVIAQEHVLKNAIDYQYAGIKAQMAAENANANTTGINIDELVIDTSAGADDAPIINLVNSLLDKAFQDNASDIHIEPLEDRVRVRIRIDGVMQEVMSNPISAKDAITTRIKILGGMNIAEKRIPQDGRITTVINGEDVDMRVSILPCVTGEKTVIRILAKNDANLNRKYLGISDRNNEMIDKMIKVPQGIVLISGPTGSGKTTTLYTLLSEKNTDEVNIITVEDPVEIRIPGLNQCQVNVKAGMTFASGLRSILRQDPDIILVGEIRDGETAEIAMRAAITGHLVFSTIHTNDAVSSINRLIDMGLEPYMVSSALVGVISQRLVRRICTNCRESYDPDEYDRQFLRLDAGQKLYRGKGCTECNEKGYKGRIAIHEIVTITRKMKTLLEKRASEDEMRVLAVEEGTQMLQDSARDLVLEGITTVDELNRVAYTID